MPRSAVRVLIAPDGFGGTLTAARGRRRRSRDGWRAAAPDDDVDLCPLSDGGPGFLDDPARAASAASSSP